MKTVLWRYIGFEVNLRTFSILVLLAGIMSIAEGLEYLEEIAAGKLPFRALGPLLALSMPELLSLALPMALFFGVLTTVARLSSDSELKVLGAAGIGLYGLLPIVATLTGLAMMVEIGLTLIAVPAAAAHRAEALQALQQHALTHLLAAQEFYEFPDGRVLYFDARGDQGQFKDLFFYNPQAQPPVAIGARSGQLQVRADGSLAAVFNEGQRLQARLHPTSLRRVFEFARYRIIQAAPARGSSQKGDPETRSSSRLLQQLQAEPRAHQARVELYRRLAFPLGLPALVLLAFPLGAASVRERGHSAALAGGGLGLLAYHHCLIVIEEWAGRGAVAPHWLLWAVPLPVLASALYLLRQRAHARPLIPGLTALWHRRFTWRAH